jgi:HAD superfamily hydrolase (TIGR01509 family)
LAEIGVVFDCDGTLVDSEPLSGEAWRQTLAPYGYAISDQDVANVVGRSYAYTHAYLAERVALPDAATFWPQLRDVLFNLIDAHLQPFPDAVAAVKELHARGVPVAVASSSLRERLDRTLARAGLAFDVSVAGDEVEHGKPAPDMFLLAAHRLGVTPQRCVAVEDSPPGVAAAHAAGMRTLGVCRVEGTEPALGQADRVVNIISAADILELRQETPFVMKRSETPFVMKRSPHGDNLRSGA